MPPSRIKHLYSPSLAVSGIFEKAKEMKSNEAMSLVFNTPAQNDDKNRITAFWNNESAAKEVEKQVENLEEDSEDENLNSNEEMSIHKIDTDSRMLSR